MAAKTLLPIHRVSVRPRRSPFDNVFDTFFNDSRLPVATGNGSTWAPHVDVTESDAAYAISAELPGLEERDIEVTVADGILTLKGEKNAVEEKKRENYYRQERAYGRFERSFRLPDEVQADKVEAQFKNGVLTVGLPKSEEAQSVVHRVQIKTS